MALTPEQLGVKIDRYLPEVVSLCQRLVQIPSENPPGDTRAIAHFVAGHLSNLLTECNVEGLVHLIAPQKHMPNVVSTVEGLPGGRHLIFNGHLDTFPAGDPDRWDAPPFSGLIQNGRLYGRGSADMKGGLAASMFAFSMLCRMRRHWKGKATITLVSDEETGARWGSQYLLENYEYLKGTALLNGEPSGVHMVSLGEKGRIWMNIEIRTSGGHGAYAFSANHAIDIAAAIVLRLKSIAGIDGADEAVNDWLNKAKQYYDSVRGPGACEATKKVTVNCGVIRGGLKVNMLPEHSSLEIDIRLPPGITCEQMKQRVRAIIEEFQGCDIRVDSVRETEATVTHDTGPGSLFQAVHESALKATGGPVYPIITLGGTDARLWRDRGVPAVVYGPEHYNMGSANEYILVKSLEIAARVQTEAAFKYLRC